MKMRPAVCRPIRQGERSGHCAACGVDAGPAYCSRAPPPPAALSRCLIHFTKCTEERDHWPHLPRPLLPLHCPVAYCVHTALTAQEDGATGPARRGRPPRCIVLAPTRELANQVAKEFESVCPSLKVSMGLAAWCWGCVGDKGCCSSFLD